MRVDEMVECVRSCTDTSEEKKKKLTQAKHKCVTTHIGVGLILATHLTPFYYSDSNPTPTLRARLGQRKIVGKNKGSNSEERIACTCLEQRNGP